MRRILIFVMAFIVALFCLTSCGSKVTEIVWSDIYLYSILPEPQSLLCEVHSNSDDYLSLCIHDISEADFKEYSTKLKDAEYNIELEQTDYSFEAYNESGYKVSLYYDDSSEELDLKLSAPEKYDVFVWPNDNLTKQIPMPESNIGRVESVSEEFARIYVAEMTYDSYKSYINLCIQKGFNKDLTNEDKYYLAQNSEGYKIRVEYVGNKVICITIDEPIYDISLELSRVENLLFSTYDVNVYIDDLLEDTISNGETETYELELNKGEHIIKFENAEDYNVVKEFKINVSKNDKLQYEIHCSKLNIDVKSPASELDNQNQDISTNSSASIEETNALFYSTNDYETAKNGNIGVFSYKNKSGSYDVYWIIDFDDGYVYWFTDGNGENNCDKVKIVSGSLNDKIEITWHDSGEEWSWYLHFKYVNHPETLIVTDHNGFDLDFTTTDLSEALKVRDSKNIKLY